MNIKEEYLSLLQSPERQAQAAARIGRDNVFLLLQDMTERGYLQSCGGGALARAEGRSVLRITQKGRVFLRASGRRAEPPARPDAERLRLERLAEEIDGLEPQLRRGGCLRLTYTDGEQETVRYTSGRYPFFAGSSGWREYGGRGSLLRGLLPFLDFLAEWSWSDAAADAAANPR